MKNLCWTSGSKNCKNKKSYKGYEAEYVEEIDLEVFERFEFYNEHVFGHYFINPITCEMYYYNDYKYRKIEIRLCKGYEVYCLRDVEDESCKVSLIKLRAGKYN